jgi:hypothetical protein
VTEGWSAASARRALGAVTRALVSRNRAKRPPSRKVALVVPLSTRSELLPDEIVSLRHLRHFLRPYEKFMVAPRGSHVSYEGFTPVYFDRKFFGSAAAHNPLLYWPRFYKAFEEYEFILIYHLDCLVFSDQLLQWCDAGYDYIGAPWMPGPDTPWVTEPCVGNGGFALMNVGSALAALHERYRQRPETYWSDMLLRNQGRLRVVRWALERLRTVAPSLRFVSWPLRQWQMSSNPGIYGANSDYFWSFAAAHYSPGFRVAPLQDGLRFAFETSPRQCFEANQHQLPFGCHAWAKYDRQFWEPHLLPAHTDERTTSDEPQQVGA